MHSCVATVDNTEYYIHDIIEVTVFVYLVSEDTNYTKSSVC